VRSFFEFGNEQLELEISVICSKLPLAEFEEALGN
jgi:hypothetical protein